MMVSVVNDGLDGKASVPGYTIAGKTGTAEIPTPIGYENGASIASFIGFFPADDPQVIVLIKLDRPADYWGSQTAAPAFQQLAERLVLAAGNSHRRRAPRAGGAGRRGQSHSQVDAAM